MGVVLAVFTLTAEPVGWVGPSTTAKQVGRSRYPLPISGRVMVRRSEDSWWSLTSGVRYEPVVTVEQVGQVQLLIAYDFQRYNDTI